MDKKKPAETVSFSAQYKDPRWQKKRLEILERDNFTCRDCGDTESKLNVHHLYYSPDKKVWEYDNITYLTLCDDCHKSEHDGNPMRYINAMLIDKKMSNPSNQNTWMRIICTIDQANLSHKQEESVMIAIMNVVKATAVVSGVSQ